MKTNKIHTFSKWLPVLGLVWSLYGCDRDYLKYDTSQKDLLYIVGPDTTGRAFEAGSPVDSLIYNVPLQVMGMPKAYERKYQIEIIDTATTAVEGVHYKFNKTNLFPKDTTLTYMAIILYRDRDPELEANPVTLAFKLVESDDFAIMPVEYYTVMNHLTISIAHIVKPRWWNVTILGPYTEKAHYMFLNYYSALEQANPVIYNRLVKKYGKDMSSASTFVWSQDGTTLRKFVVRPLYDYYLKNPDPDVQIPDPLV